MSDSSKSPVQRTPAQREAARRNGAKSRGPVTAEGKAISSRNAFRHGLSAEVLALGNEDPEFLLDMIAQYRREYRPKGATENDLVEQMAYSKWLQYRAWLMENAFYNADMSRNRAAFEAEFVQFREPVRQANALESCLARSPSSLPYLSRCLSRLSRDYFRSAHLLRQIQAERRDKAGKKHENAGTNPAISLETQAPAHESGSPAGHRATVHVI